MKVEASTLSSSSDQGGWNDRDATYWLMPCVCKGEGRGSGGKENGKKVGNFLPARRAVLHCM